MPICPCDLPPTISTEAPVGALIAHNSDLRYDKRGPGACGALVKSAVVADERATPPLHVRNPTQGRERGAWS